MQAEQFNIAQQHARDVTYQIWFSSGTPHNSSITILPTNKWQRCEISTNIHELQTMLDLTSERRVRQTR